MRLRILTQNLYNGRADVGSFMAALRSHRPDIVAVQELAPNAAEVLDEWGEAALLDPREDTTGMGVAVRGPAVFERLDFPFRSPVSVLLTADSWNLENDLQVVNTHLVNPIARPILESRELRRRELGAIRDLVTGDSATAAQILVGDFNSSPAWPLYRRLRKFLTDGAVAAGTARRTWGPWPSSPRLLRIDHAFARGPIQVTSTRTINIAGADHRGLLVDIESA
jgi:endonuclease/exonuclease/phosphatase (EEP) superfamily protein YafD